MSRPHVGHSFFSSFGNPFRMVVPKRLSHVSAKHNKLLKAFESALMERLKQLRLSGQTDFINLTWMQQAMEVLSATHTDVKSLIMDLSFPAAEWDEKWMDEYLDNTVKLLDICIALNAEVSNFEQGQLLVQYVLHLLDFSDSMLTSDKLFRAKDSLQELMEKTENDSTEEVSLKDGKIENCISILKDLSKSLHLGKLKCSSKCMVFLRAMYGVKAMTIFVCSVLASTLSGSPVPLMDLQIPDQLLWSTLFMSLQQEINEEIRSRFDMGHVTVLKELESMDAAIKNVYYVIENSLVGIPKGMEEVEQMKKAIEELQQSSELFVQGLDPLAKEVRDFFQIVLNGRKALLDSLRLSGNEEIPIGDKLPHE